MAINFVDGKYVNPENGRVTLDPTMYKDWQIAEEAEKTLPSVDFFREKLGLLPEEIIPYGKTPKIDFIKVMDRLKDKPDGKFIEVTAVTPTPFGEGKSTVSLGLIEEGQIVAAYEMLLEVGDYKDGLVKQVSIQEAYQRNQAKDKLFVDATWNEIYGVRIWLYTKVVDENTMDVIIEGSNGAADQIEERFKGKWDEATGTVQLNGAAYHIVEGKTTVTNQNLPGYIYYENGRAYVVCDADGELYTRQFKR